jgi:hypothetical protein
VLNKHHAIKAYWRVEIWLHMFLNSVLHGDEWSTSRTGRFTFRERAPGTRWTRGYVDSKAKKKISATDGNRTSFVQPVA